MVQQRQPSALRVDIIHQRIELECLSDQIRTLHLLLLVQIHVGQHSNRFSASPCELRMNLNLLRRRNLELHLRRQHLLRERRLL